MLDSWFFTCWLSCTLGSSSKCVQHTFLLQILLWYRIFICTGSTGSLFLILKEGLLFVLIDCMIFCHLSQMLQECLCQQFFSHTARLWNSLPIECFPLTYGLNGSKSKINMYLISTGSVYTFPVLILFYLFFCNMETLLSSCCAALLGVNPS